MTKKINDTEWPTDDSSVSTNDRVFIIETSTGRGKIEVPAGFIVTFSVTNTSSDRYSNGASRDLRIYADRARKDLRLAMTGVKSIRDSELIIYQEVITKSGARSWKSDSDGNSSFREEEAVDRKLLKIED